MPHYRESDRPDPLLAPRPSPHTASIVAKYFTDAGFKVLAIERIPVPWEEMGQLSSGGVYSLIKKAFLKHPGAEGIYFQGGKLRILDIIEELEQDLQVPVVHPGVAQCWEIQKRLHVRQPKDRLRSPPGRDALKTQCGPPSTP